MTFPPATPGTQRPPPPERKKPRRSGEALLRNGRCMFAGNCLISRSPRRGVGRTLAALQNLHLSQRRGYAPTYDSKAEDRCVPPAAHVLRAGDFLRPLQGVCSMYPFELPRNPVILNPSELFCLEQVADTPFRVYISLKVLSQERKGLSLSFRIETIRDGLASARPGSRISLPEKNLKMSMLYLWRVDLISLAAFEKGITVSFLKDDSCPMLKFRMLSKAWVTHGPYYVVSRPPVPRKLRDRVFNRDGKKCLYCESTEKLTVDHIKPVSKNGKTIFSNLQTLCKTCNSKKGARE